MKADINTTSWFYMAEVVFADKESCLMHLNVVIKDGYTCSSALSFVLQCILNVAVF